MIQEDRVQPRNGHRPRRGKYVLYWMQASQRAECNHALEFAVRRANELKEPLLVYFGLTAEFPEANARHYRFMLQGLRETQAALRERGIKMIIGRGSPEQGAIAMAAAASLAVCDMGYLKIQRDWRQQVATNIACPLFQVESDVIVPVATASDKEEYSAATLRRKLHRVMPPYLAPLEEQAARVDAAKLDFPSYDITDTDKALAGLKVDSSVAPVAGFQGGTAAAKKRLADFIDNRLDNYDRQRNDPNIAVTSGLSPYLHFGQISPLHIALKVLEARGSGTDAFLEELVVRRELSMNFTHYNPNYDSFSGLPDWARRSLGEHRADAREYRYSLAELEAAATHDPYWNAAQREMAQTGKMHGYMRMYWGKKILEWTDKPEEAYRRALYLNNRYELDGRDPNGFAGVAWCFGKHDQPCARRPVFGNIRYMNAAGLKRKFDADAYARRFS